MFQKSFLLFIIFTQISICSFAQKPTTYSRKTLVPIVNIIVEGVNMHTYKTRNKNHFYGDYYTKNLFEKRSTRISKFPKYKFNIFIKKNRFIKAKENVQYLPGKWAALIEKELQELEKLQNEEIELNATLVVQTQDILSTKENRKAVGENVIKLIENAHNHTTLVEKIQSQLRELLLDYPIKDTSNSWYKCGDLMNQILEESEVVLTFLKENKTKEAKEYVSKVDDLLKEIEENKTTLLEGIRKYPSEGGDVHSYFFIFHRFGQAFVSDVLKDPETFSRRSFYNSALIEFFNMQNYYNEFTNKASIASNHKVAPAYLMKQVYKKFYVEVPELNSNEEAFLNEVSEDLTMEGFKKNNLILLLDVSGSMKKKERLPLFKDAIQKVSSIMRNEDVFTVVLYSDNAKILFERKSFTDSKAMKKLLKLQTNGRTNVLKGIEKAYNLANKKYDNLENTRIIMITDGSFKLPTKIYEKVKAQNEKIQFSVFNFGEPNKANENLKKLSKSGNGNYVSVTNENHIKTLLEEVRVK
ncbi:vWA domain-containing protein [Aureivirga marina]|uniref:vWA domain-containing protein n=1 Tax=Aureivirga marina TaxID=1182451 RepID=UPI0018C96BA4|nr:VWA domain-containing protein [Aureivirga marina]